MFKQRLKKKKRLTTCTFLKHVFGANKSKCLCGNYYKANGRLYRKKGDRYVAGTTAEFRYKTQSWVPHKSQPTKKAVKRKLKAMLRK